LDAIRLTSTRASGFGLFKKKKLFWKDQKDELIANPKRPLYYCELGELANSQNDISLVVMT
jgi:hypothetical protein